MNIILRKFKNINNENILFHTGLFLKIILGATLASYFLSDLFINFINYFTENNYANPYEKFVDLGKSNVFPYPALMLYIMALPKILFGCISDNKFYSLFLLRLPLIVADILIFLILKSWLKNKFNMRLIVFYWFSPVLIYISYIHGQLDVIPISLLITSMYFLFKSKFNLAAVILGLALATKTNILLVYPFFFLFLVSKQISIINLLMFFAISFGCFFLINLPYIFNLSFIEMVFQNQEQGKIFNSFLTVDNMSIYIIPGALMLLFVRGWLLKNYNRDIFIMFLGYAFGIILLFIPPMQGWYFWLIPFLSYFYIKEEGRSPFLFFGLQMFYLLYFILSKNADYLEIMQFVATKTSKGKILYDILIEKGINSQILLNLTFTMLQTTLFLNCTWIYKRGLTSYSKYKIISSPFLIGVGGNSGVGKTTVSDAIASIFTKQNTTLLCGDDMHKWQRGHEKWHELTHLNPKANHLHEEVYFLKRLKMGKKIYRRHYEHSTGKFTKELMLRSNNIIIFEGLHPFYLQEQRKIYDVKIFVRPTDDLVYHWKIIRDMQKRGYSKEKVISSIKKRDKDSKKYIETQMDKADILIIPMPSEKIKNIGDKDEKVDVYYKIVMSNSIYIESLVNAFAAISTLKISHDYMQKDQQEIIIKGFCNNDNIKKIAENHIQGLQNLGIDNPVWPSDAFGVSLTFIIYYLFERAENDRT